jgi:hypothetical protein
MARELINLEDEESLGPAMRELSERQRAFVVGIVQHGLSQAKAFEAAGYAPDPSNAYKLARKPGIQAALLELGHQVLRLSGADAIRVLGKLMLDASVEPKDRISCAKIILDRSGFIAVTKHEVAVEHHLSEAEVDRKLNQLAQELGLAKRAEAITIEATPVLEPPKPDEDMDDLLIGIAPND